MSAIRYDSKTVAEVQRLSDAGWSQRAIRRVMLRENGSAPSCETISRWLSPSYAEKSRARVRRRETATRARRWTFGLAGQGGRQTDAYRAAFIRRLRAEDVPRTSIAKVCTVVFGEPVTRRHVCAILGEAA